MLSFRALNLLSVLGLGTLLLATTVHAASFPDLNTVAFVAQVDQSGKTTYELPFEYKIIRAHRWADASQSSTYRGKIYDDMGKSSFYRDGKVTVSSGYALTEPEIRRDEEIDISRRYVYAKEGNKVLMSPEEDMVKHGPVCLSKMSGLIDRELSEAKVLPPFTIIFTFHQEKTIKRRLEGKQITYTINNSLCR